MTRVRNETKNRIGGLERLYYNSNEEVFDKLAAYISNRGFRGWDPYDFLKCRFIDRKSLNNTLVLILTQANRISPLNFRPLLAIDKSYNSKAMALFLTALLNYESNRNKHTADFIKDWLIANKSKRYTEYTIGFTFDIVLKHYHSFRGSPSLIITLFTMYAFIQYWKKTKDEEVLKSILSFYHLIQNKLPYFETADTLWYSYNFEKVNEIYNATAKVGKFYALLFNVTDDTEIPSKIEKILNYLATKQRNDGSWAYGQRISYTDGFHTAFVLEAIWYMRRVVDDSTYQEMFKRGLDHYKEFMFKASGQPLYFHALYKPKDIRRYLIETDIRDCAMAIILFSKTGDPQRAKKVFNWTMANMYDHEKAYFYYYKNMFWTNKIEFIRWQAWMLYALSHLKNVEEPKVE